MCRTFLAPSLTIRLLCGKIPTYSLMHASVNVQKLMLAVSYSECSIGSWCFGEHYPISRVMAASCNGRVKGNLALGML